MDIFSSGVLLYLLTAGVLPFGDDRNKDRTMELTCAMDITFRRSQSKSIRRLVRRMCCAHQDRPNAQEVRRAILRLMQRSSQHDAQPLDSDHGIGVRAHLVNDQQDVTTLFPESSSSVPCIAAPQRGHDDVMSDASACVIATQQEAELRKARYRKHAQGVQDDLPSVKARLGCSQARDLRSFVSVAGSVSAPFLPAMEHGELQSSSERCSRHSSSDSKIATPLICDDLRPVQQPRMSGFVNKIRSSVCASPPPRSDLCARVLLAESTTTALPSAVSLNAAEAKRSMAIGLSDSAAREVSQTDASHPSELLHTHVPELVAAVPLGLPPSTSRPSGSRNLDH
eukprot:TRINITY_DN18131_c1_g1_i1.p2 TRINITY_DN18131_c1_g1~~TRINITY_DN18131_c1_g1_i1.p2  ORF type:complete len:340 (-),score=32.49 TRINITY_DN18131_c1_g1_i1:287-1306(-)